MEPERQNVYKAYDRIAHWFATNRDTSLQEKKYLDHLIDRIPAGGTVLDLGCGTGQPILKYLVDQELQVTGVDASAEMLAIAAVNFPSTEFRQIDMRKLNLAEKFEAIIAWHSFFHLPADDQPAMFPVFAEHLKSGGILLFTSGTIRGEAWGMNGGENLFHASLDKAEYEQLLRRNQFKILSFTESDPDCGLATVWMVERG